MRQLSRIVAVALALALLAAGGALAQLPGGLPGASSLFSKDTLLTQAKALLADLTSMKSSGRLQPAQTAQVDEMLPKATSLTRELEKPQVEPSRLPELAKNLSDLQQQAGALKALLR